MEGDENLSNFRLMVIGRIAEVNIGAAEQKIIFESRQSPRR